MDGSGEDRHFLAYLQNHLIPVRDDNLLNDRSLNPLLMFFRLITYSSEKVNIIAINWKVLFFYRMI